MGPIDKSYRRAMEIIGLHKANLEQTCAEVLLSVVLVGSLTNGSYTAGPGSDIDLVHILKPGAPAGARAEVVRCIERTETLSNHDLPISKCVYFLGDLSRPYRKDFELSRENMDYLELPIEILRMKDSGITVYGEELVPQIERPTREDILDMLRRIAQWERLLQARDPQWAAARERSLAQPSPRMIAQCVLTGAMLDLFLATGLSCSSKKDIAPRMKALVPEYPYQDLLDWSARWRYRPETLTQAEEPRMLAAFQAWRKERADSPPHTGRS